MRFRAFLWHVQRFREKMPPGVYANETKLPLKPCWPISGSETRLWITLHTVHNNRTGGKQALFGILLSDDSPFITWSGITVHAQTHFLLFETQKTWLLWPFPELGFTGKLHYYLSLLLWYFEMKGVDLCRLNCSFFDFFFCIILTTHSIKSTISDENVYPAFGFCHFLFAIKWKRLICTWLNFCLCTSRLKAFAI